MPPGIAAALAATVAVPLPLSANDSPAGRIDAAQPPTGVESLNAGAGEPLVVTGKLPAVPDVNVFDEPLVNVGACPTVTVNFCVAFGETPFAAVKHSVYMPLETAPGSATISACPRPIAVNVKPVGSDDAAQLLTGLESLTDASGAPAVVTTKDPPAAGANNTELPLRNDGATGV